MKFCRQYRAFSTFAVLAAIIFSANVAHARPYDCPNTSTKKRSDYVCEMNGRLAPDFWNSWGEIKKNASLPFSRHSVGLKKCDAQCVNDFNACTADCPDTCDGKPAKCGVACEARCKRVNQACDRKCSNNDFKSGFRNESGTLVPLVNSLISECERSNGGMNCEIAEAKPYCDAMLPRLTAYKQAIAAKPRSLRTIAAMFKDAFLSIRETLSKRHKALSDEINTKKFKCSKKFATKPPAPNQVACIDAQYKFSSSAAALVAFSTPITAAARQRVGREIADAEPDPGLVGCNVGYCWEPPACDGGPKLVQNFWPTQILNYFGLPIGGADGWQVGDVVTIEDEEFPIVCISHGSGSGGDTNCGNSPASFDIVVVDKNYRPSSTFPPGTCVANN